MRLAAKDLDIGTGGPLIVIMHKLDAERMDLHSEDRVVLRRGKLAETAILDLSVSDKLVRPGTLGLMDEMVGLLGAKDGDAIDIQLAKKPESIQHIRSKLDGKVLSAAEIDDIIRDISNNRLSEIETTYFVAATYVHGLSLEEVAAMTRSMVRHGEKLCVRAKPVMDKHCIGGVPGNRTTMVVVPIVAAAGLTIPKTSSRAITSAAGTADAMEVLANVEISDLPALHRIVEKVGGCIIWGGSLKLAPADDKIIRVEKPLSIDAEGQLLASVMAKKYSVCASDVLIDIPIGEGAKIADRKQARHLGMHFEEIGAMLGMRVRVIITDGSQPIGNGVGPALEARDVLWVLLNDSRAPNDLREKALLMAGHLLEMGKTAPPGKGKALAEGILSSGKAYEKMREIIAAQGKRADRPEDIPLGKRTYAVRAPRSGTVRSVDNKVVARVARACGCPKDRGSGLYFHKHVGDRVRKGELLFTLYADSKEKLAYAKELLSVLTPYTLR